jgi:hypothetical protein
VRGARVRLRQLVPASLHFSVALKIQDHMHKRMDLMGQEAPAGSGIQTSKGTKLAAKGRRAALLEMGREPELSHLAMLIGWECMSGYYFMFRAALAFGEFHISSGVPSQVCHELSQDGVVAWICVPLLICSLDN